MPSTLTLNSMTSVCASNVKNIWDRNQLSRTSHTTDTLIIRMSSILAPSRTMLSFQCHKLIARTAPTTYRRAISTIPSNKHIVSDTKDTTGL